MEVISFLIIGLGRSEGFIFDVSEGFVAFLFGANANGIVNGHDEDFAIADLAGFGRFDNGSGGRLDPVIGKDDFEFDFWQEIHGVFTAAVDFGVAFLPPESLHLSDRHSFNADFTERIFHFLQFEWFYYRFDFLHSLLGLVGPTTAAAARARPRPANRFAFRNRPLCSWRLAPLVPALLGGSQSPIKSGVYVRFIFFGNESMTFF
jgi:hypothetical protein